MVFAGNDGSGNAGQPWITDGTEAGTALIATITTPSDTPPTYWGAPPEGFTAAGSVVYFTADDGVHGSELWRTDGTAAGTTMIKDIATGTFTGWDNEPRPESSYPSGIVPFAGGILFTAEDGVNGGELWKSDGTAAGTYLLTVLGNDGGSPAHSTTFLLTVTAPPGDFQISVNPMSLTVNRKSSGTATVSLTALGASTAVTLSISGLPAKASATFTPNPVTTSGNSTLKITTNPKTPTGTYTVTITGTNQTKTHTTSLQLTIR